MSKTIIQIPIDKSFRDEATRAATDMGFSSLQENIRVYLKHLIKGDIKLFSSQEPTVILSPEAAARYDKMIDDIESGKVKTKKFDDVDELMKHLTK